MTKRIVVFGDSIVHGVGDIEKGGWVARLRLYLDKDNSKKDFSVYNRGISGDKTEDLLKRFKVECSAINPEIIIFAIGENDSQYITRMDNPRVPLNKFEKTLKN